MNEDLRLIKKYYGEDMSHLCRSLFSTILEKEGLLFKLISSKFAYSKNLYSDIIEQGKEDDFKNLIYSMIDVEKEEIEITKSPKELLDEAGYILYECKSEEDIQYFKKYYKVGEELCTFRGGRLKHCYIFFAVKKNVDEIKRESFINPKRQDEYGTSVISIQFTKGNNNTLSIKNRYNHTVNNPDATFSNNLDNIIQGLTQSFENEYNLNINSEKTSFELDNYVRANDGKYYRYNYGIYNTYYCENNIIIDNFEVIHDYEDKNRYLIIDYFILDRHNKEIKLYDQDIDDSMIDSIKNITKIEIKKEKETNNKKIYITTIEGTVIIEINNKDQIVSYDNNYIDEIGDHFLAYNETLRQLNLPKVEQIGNCFLYNNEELTQLNLPKVEETGYYSLEYNETLRKISLPKVKDIGIGFLSRLDTSLLEGLVVSDDIDIEKYFPGYYEKHFNGGKQKTKCIGH